jgi:methionine biosynthesis protein MetW
MSGYASLTRPTLLAHLHDVRQVTGYGLEIDDNNIELCIKAGVNVIHTDLNQGLSDFMDNSFDYVMMTQAIQTIRRPDKLLMEILRLGREGIVTFPNFGHWRARFSLFFGGVMPVSRALPNEWYNTENIHLCTLRDFDYVSCWIFKYSKEQLLTLNIAPVRLCG